MSDLFHPDVPDEFISEVLDIANETPQHKYQILTKRAQRLAELGGRLDWPSNVWMGVSIESQRYAFRADLLREVPSAIRFISAEPLLEHVEINLANIDWLIAGGESGPNARTISPEWVTSLRDSCVSENVAFFFKQWGGKTPKAGGRMLDGRTWDEMPTPQAA
jgi:protein gp37